MDVVVCDDDADILGLELGDDVLDVLDRYWVYTCERLVQEDELGVDGQGPCYLAAAALASGELDTVALAYLGETELIDQGLQAVASLLLGELGERKTEASWAR